MEKSFFDKEIGIDSFISGVKYEIPLPWPQDSPPDDTYLGSQTRDAMSGSNDVQSVKKQLGVEYSISPPWPHDRPALTSKSSDAPGYTERETTRNTKQTDSNAE